MSSTDDDAPHSPELGASSSKGPPPPLDAESEASDDGEDKRARKVANKSYKRPRIEWRTVLHFPKGDEATMGEDEMKLRITEEYNKFMEESRLVRLPGHVAQPTDRGLWKLKSEYKIEGGRTLVTWCQCPMAYRFGCKVQIKLFDGPTYMSLDVRGEHNADSHSGDKEKSKHLSVKQIEAIHTGVRISPAQSARSLRRNLANFQCHPDQQINPLKISAGRSLNFELI